MSWAELLSVMILEEYILPSFYSCSTPHSHCSFSGPILSLIIVLIFPVLLQLLGFLAVLLFIYCSDSAPFRGSALKTYQTLAISPVRSLLEFFHVQIRMFLSYLFFPSQSQRSEGIFSPKFPLPLHSPSIFLLL